MATKHTRATSRTRDEWARLIEGWKSSGLTAAEFAAKHELHPKALLNWEWRLRKQPGRAEKVEHPKLLEVSVADLVGLSGTETARWELTTSAGHTLRVLKPVPATELKALLAAIVRGTGRK